MIRSLIISQARKLANDNDSTNPFHSDALIHAFIDNWEMEIARETRFPRKSQTISFAVGEGGATGKTLDTDFLTILGVFFEPASGTGSVRLSPTTEEQLTEENADWRQLGNAMPTRYMVMDSMTVAAAAFPSRTISTDRPTSEARTMRIYGIQMPAAATDGTKSPVCPPTYHLGGVYYCAANMMLPRNPAKGAAFMEMYRTELRRCKTLQVENADNTAQIWDFYPSLDNA